MIRKIFLKSIFCVLVCGSLSAADPVELFPAQQKRWKQAGPGSFKIENNIATARGGMGMWWYSGKSYSNATFDIEFRLLDHKWNSGIFVRFPNPGNDPWVAIRKGYECQVNGDKVSKQATGGIFDIQAPSHITLNKPGEWNHYQITTWRNKIIIVINGELVNVFTAHPGRGDKQGYIGLQNHDPESQVSYRKVLVREWKNNLTLDQVLEKIGVTRADWAKFYAARHPKSAWWQKMDIGPVWANVFEDHYQGKKRVATLKGVALDLSHTDSIKGLFDTETLRMSSAFQGGVHWSGTPWTGAHGGINRMGNKNSSIMQTSLKPGWGDRNGSFADQRKFKGYGNLAKEHGRFRGHYRHGSQVILDYTVHGSRVLELPTGGVFDSIPLVFRQMDLAESNSHRVMLVSDDIGGHITIDDTGTSAIISKTPLKNINQAPVGKPDKVSIVKDRTAGAWSELSMGAPSDRDPVDRKVNKKTYFRVIPGYTQTHPSGGDEEGVAVRLNDGLAARNDDDVERNFFFADKKNAGRLEMNLAGKQEIHRIHLYSHHKGNRAPQNVEIYGAATDTADPKLAVKELVKGGWERIASYQTGALGDGGKHGVAILSPKSKSIGKFHKLLFICNTGRGNNLHTFFSEIDIYGKKAPLLKPLALKGVGNQAYCIRLKGPKGLRFTDGGNGSLTLHIPASKKPTRFTIGYGTSQKTAKMKVFKALAAATPEPRELTSLTKGGPSIYPEVVEVEGKLGEDKDTWAVDSITLPVTNPWNSMIKPGGLDLFSDENSAAISTWNGDVWIVRGLKGDWKKLKWRRFATGLYEPLGLKIVDDIVYVNGRDQITRLHDQNKDGEADWYECFNNDVYVTSNFHEFTFGLQTDNEGRFYLAKGAPVLAGGRGFDRILPHNGTLLRISKDGKRLDVLATGLRAPGGIGVGPNGEITSGENEGSWQPCCKLNYFTGRDKFLGVEDAAHHLKGKKMHLPLCYFPMRIDNSGGGQVWVPEGVDWGMKSGELIHLSYGQSALYRVLRQEVDGVMQGGVVRIPVKLDSAAMRARFHKDGSLYVTGFRGWQTNAPKQQALHRIRHTGKAVTIPDRLEATEKGIYIRFEKKLDASAVADRFNFKVERWKYIRSKQYGSGEFSIDNPDLKAEKQALIQESQKYRKHDTVEVAKSVLLPDGKTVFLVIPSMKPAEQMSIRYTLRFADTGKAEGEIIHTVHKLGKHKDDTITKLEQGSDNTLKNLSAGLHQMVMANGKVDHRVARVPAQYVGTGDAVSDMLGKEKGGEFISKWTGFLVLNERVTPQFSFQGAGVAELKLDGNSILKESGKLGFKKSAAIQLNPGAHRFELIYTGLPDGNGHVRVMWQGKTFPRQGIAPIYFKHQPSQDLSLALDVRRGRDLLVQQNCIRCHTSDQSVGIPELKYSGPSMNGIGSRVSQVWLTKWLTSPHKMKPGTTMPAFVDADTEQGRKDAADMAAYLASLKNSASPSPIEEKPDDVKLGGGKFHELGCIACHSAPNQMSEGSEGRTPLNNINAKYGLSSLAAFLKKPDKYHASIKMPDFGLSDDEARQLAAFLRSLSKGKETQLGAAISTKGDATRGKQLVMKHNCASCHSGLPVGQNNLPSFSKILARSWKDHGCVSSHKNDKLPLFNLSDGERASLEVFRGTVPKDFGQSSSYDFAERQLKALNCAACHERDGVPSLLSSLHSQSQIFAKGVPQDTHHKIDQSRPSLTYIGEMIHTDYIHSMLDGSLSPRPRPWLAMKMPAFHSHTGLIARGISAQHGMEPSKVNLPKLDAEKIKIGKKLIGSQGGFACTICHGNAGAKPLAAFEVEGINFDQVARRLRSGYYHRWMENPQSITPTTKMPRYTMGNKSPLPDYDHDAQKQFDAILEYFKSLEKKK